MYSTVKARVMHSLLGLNHAVSSTNRPSFHRTPMLRATASFLLALVFALPAGAQTTVQQPPAAAPQKELRTPDVIFVPTPQEVVEAMLKVADVHKGDVLYDLGSGDGRIPITAAQKYGIERGIGIDINPERIKEANENLGKAGVGERVRFVNADLFESDLSEATVVTLYLLPAPDPPAPAPPPPQPTPPTADEDGPAEGRGGGEVELAAGREYNEGKGKT